MTQPQQEQMQHSRQEEQISQVLHTQEAAPELVGGAAGQEQPACGNLANPTAQDLFEEFNLDDIEVIESKVFA